MKLFAIYKAYETAKGDLKKMFSHCNVAYTNSLVIDSCLENYAGLVSYAGISKKLLPVEV